jgi:hypothetical protein
MLDVQPEASGRHQPARDNRPSGNQPDERNNGEARPEKSDNARGDIEQPSNISNPQRSSLRRIVRTRTPARP